MDSADVDHGPEETEPLLGALLRMPYQAMMAGAVEPALAAAGFGDVRSAHLPVLQALTQHPAGLRATELAAHARITKQSMGYLVDHLEAGGYVERAPDPADRRARVVRLTPRGRAMLRAALPIIGEIEAAWLRRMGRGAGPDLRSALERAITADDSATEPSRRVSPRSFGCLMPR